VKGAKNKRMYAKVKRSAKRRGRSSRTAKRIAAVTVHKRRSQTRRSARSR